MGNSISSHSNADKEPIISHLTFYKQCSCKYSFLWRCVSDVPVLRFKFKLLPRVSVVGAIFFCLAQQPSVAQDRLIFDVSRSHAMTHHSSVGLLWTKDRSVLETCTRHHITLTLDGHPCSQRDSNPQSQQARGRRPSP